MDGSERWPTGRLLSAVARRVEREWDAHLAAWDLNHASLPVLVLLAGGPASQRELARSTGVTEQTMSRVVARLERSGYVVRQAHAGDARRHQVTLTAAGRSTLGEAGDPRVAEQLTVRGLDPDQVARLRELLGAMVAVPTDHPDAVGHERPAGHVGAPAHDAGPVDRR